MEPCFYVSEWHSLGIEFVCLKQCSLLFRIWTWTIAFPISITHSEHTIIRTHLQSIGVAIACEILLFCALLLSWAHFSFLDLLQIAVTGSAPSLQQQQQQQQQPPQSIHHLGDDNLQGSVVLDSNTYDFKLEKSNILMLGPTGSGQFSRFFQCKIFSFNHVRVAVYIFFCLFSIRDIH